MGSNIKRFNYICIGLILVAFILVLLPYWNFGEQSISIGTYIASPTRHENLTNYFKQEITPSYQPVQVFHVVLAIFVCGVLGIIFGLAKSDYAASLVCPAACGLFGLFGFLTEPSLQYGSMWAVHLVVYLAMLVVAIAGFAARAAERSREKQEQQAARARV